jgi:hypothetical protein
VGGHRRVVVGEGVHKLLLAVAVLGDGGGALDQLTKVVVEVHGFAGLVGREDLVDGEPQLAHSLIMGEDHVGDVLVDGGMKEVEDGVVLGRPCGIGRRGSGGAVDVADETCPPERGLHVDRPLGVVVALKKRTTGATWRGAPLGARAPVGMVMRAPVVELRGAEVVLAAEGVVEAAAKRDGG